MRLIKSFFILLIGMISFTVLGTTTHLEQKQKPLVNKEFISFQTFVNVAAVEVVQNGITCFRDTCFKTELFRLKQIETTLKYVDDVGWKYLNKSILGEIMYKENLNKEFQLISDKITYNCRC